MRIPIAAGLVLLLAGSTTTAQTGSRDDSAAAARSRTPTTLRLLNQRIEEVSLREAPLDQVVDWIASLTSMNVVVRWQALEEMGVERGKPITMQLRNLRLSQVLWMVLNEAGGPDLNLAYRASGELLIISTTEDLGKEMVLKIYDVSDLLVRAPDFANAPRPEFNRHGGFSGAGVGSQRNAESNRQPEEDRADIDDLIELITETVEPDSWVKHGGLGTIRAFGEVLVVRNNLHVQQVLGGFVGEGS